MNQTKRNGTHTVKGKTRLRNPGREDLLLLLILDRSSLAESHETCQQHALVIFQPTSKERIRRYILHR